MPVPRYRQINQQTKNYYHIYSRCVQQERLCGYDPKTCKDYSHRKAYMLKRLYLLVSIFPVDLASHSILDDHYHLALFHKPERVDQWDDETVVRLWLTLHKGPPFMRRWFNGEKLSQNESDQVESQIHAWRDKLKTLSYFMKCFNEKLSKEFNKESDKTGAFWEKRFCSKELNSEADLIKCMSYVDLNPVHAGIANNPDESEYTSFREREQKAYIQSDIISQGLEDGEGDTLANYGIPVKWLMPFKDQIESEEHSHIEFTYTDYREFVYWVGQIERPDKGTIKTRPKLAEQMRINESDFESVKRRFQVYRQDLISVNASSHLTDSG